MLLRLRQNNLSVTQQILRNNTILITEPIATVKTVAIGFWFSAGSRYENEKNRGISHFVEHMLFKGTETKSAFELACAFDKIGGYVNAFTEREQICLQCVVPANFSDYAFSILCDMTENSVFSPVEFEKERSVIESEIISSQDDPEEAALDSVLLAVLPDNSISWNICGSVESVRNLTVEDLRAWYQHYIKNGELVICVSGNIDEAQIQNVAEKLSRKAEIGTVSSEIFQKKRPEWCSTTGTSSLHYLKADFQQEQIMLLFPLQLPVTENRYYTLAVLNALTGDTMSSRLFQLLREKGGFCYNVYSFFTICMDCGFWAAYCSVPKNKAAEVCRLLKEEMCLIKESFFADDEISAAKEHLCGEEIIGGEDIESRMKRLYRNFSYGFVQCSIEESIRKIRAVTEDELKECITELFNFDNEAFVFYGPEFTEKQKQKIEKGVK